MVEKELEQRLEQMREQYPKTIVLLKRYIARLEHENNVLKNQINWVERHNAVLTGDLMDEKVAREKEALKKWTANSKKLKE